MKESKKSQLRRAAIKRKLNRLIKRSGFAPQDLPDAIESKLAEGFLPAELSEEEAREIALDNHPDLKVLDRAGALPSEMLDEQEGLWNPIMHIALHTVIERQLATNEPKGIVDLAIKLEREKKISAHEIKHVIASALADQIWCMQRENVPFNEEQYLAEIEAAYPKWCRPYEKNDHHEGK